MRTGLARAGGTLGAFVWLVGVPYIGMAGIIPSNAEFFAAGAVGALLGVCVIPLVWAPILATGHTRVRRVVALAAVAVGVVTAATSLLEALAAEGALGASAPQWVAGAAAIALTAVFVWVLAVTAAFRGSLPRGLVWLGVATGAGFLVSTGFSELTTVIFPSFVVTNATIPFVLVLGLAMWLGLPPWLGMLVWMQPRAAAQSAAPAER